MTKITATGVTQMVRGGVVEGGGLLASGGEPLILSVLSVPVRRLKYMPNPQKPKFAR